MVVTVCAWRRRSGSQSAAIYGVVKWHALAAQGHRRLGSTRWRKNQYWFPAKRFGWGWGPPTTWQGWAVLIVWLAAIASAAFLLMPAHLVAFLLFNLILIATLVAHLLCEGRATCLEVGRERVKFAARCCSGFFCPTAGYVHAQTESSVTVYGGYRFGGSVTNTTNDSTIDLETIRVSHSPSISDWIRTVRVELFYSQQHTALTSGAFSSQANNIGLTLYNYQIGGTAFIEEVGRGLYVMGGIGATTAKPDHAGLNSETFSLRQSRHWLDGAFAPHVGLRFEARGYGILLNNNSALFCGGTAGCTVAIKGSGIFEGEVLGGLTFRF